MSDTEEQPDPGRPTGRVLFGPRRGPGAGSAPGASNSVAQKDFHCADNVGQRSRQDCHVIIAAGVDRPWPYPPAAKRESLDITVQALVDGVPSEPKATAVIAGDAESKNYPLVLKKWCGRVLVTVSTREVNTGADNPEGIQSKFEARLINHYCRNP